MEVVPSRSRVLSPSKRWNFRLYWGQTAADFIVMLERVTLLIEVPRLYENDWISQQDNVAIHNARRTFDFIMAILLDHPACSFDLNHIENVWVDGKRCL